MDPVGSCENALGLCDDGRIDHAAVDYKGTPGCCQVRVHDPTCPSDLRRIRGERRIDGIELRGMDDLFAGVAERLAFLAFAD